MSAGKEETRRLVAEFLRVGPEEIVLTRNTSEANNLVSSGLDLKAGDEVLVFADNHPSNDAAWMQKAKRFGYTVTTIAQPTRIQVRILLDAVTSHHGPDARARFHASDQHRRRRPSGGELCRIAREHGVLTLVDGVHVWHARSRSSRHPAGLL